MITHRKYEVKAFRSTTDIEEYFNKFQEYTVVGFTKTEYTHYEVLCYKTIPVID
jgi:hypothetical protein